MKERKNERTKEWKNEKEWIMEYEKRMWKGLPVWCILALILGLGEYLSM